MFSRSKVRVLSSPLILYYSHNLPENTLSVKLLSVTHSHHHISLFNLHPVFIVLYCTKLARSYRANSTQCLRYATITINKHRYIVKRTLSQPQPHKYKPTPVTPFVQ